MKVAYLIISWFIFNTFIKIRGSQVFTVIIICTKERFLPHCLIEIHPKKDVSPSEYQAFLKQLNKSLPGLKLSSVEYAVDFFCKTPEAAESLFENLAENLYIPYQRAEVKEIGETLSLFGNRDRLSRVVHIGKTLKIYERGEDNNRTSSGGWIYEKLDRVRIEHTASRNELKKNGLPFLEDIIKDSKFSDIVSPKLNFRQFKSGTLPEPWEYEKRGKSRGHFQDEQLHARKKIKNITQSTEPVPEFASLLKRINKSMKLFERKWLGKRSKKKKGA